MHYVLLLVGTSFGGRKPGVSEKYTVVESESIRAKVSLQNKSKSTTN